MNRFGAVIAGGAVGVAAMLAFLQPWKEKPRREAPAPPSQGDPALEAAELAWSKLEAAELDEAQRLIAKAASLNPQLFEVPLYQGYLDMSRGQYAAARRSFTEALERKPDEPRALTGRATARFELKEFAGAVEDATKAIQDNSEALFIRASAYAGLERQEESIRDWTTYVKRYPMDSGAWMNRGNAHARLGRKEAAVADWEQAVALDAGLRDQLAPLISKAKQ